MEHIFEHALLESLKMLPFLFIIYFGIEILEYFYSGTIKNLIVKTQVFGPLVGTIFGLFPQCGFSVVGAALYSQRLISIGTLIAIFLATSDEAIPIILAQPANISLIAPLLVSKAIIALIGGYSVDLVFRKTRLTPIIKNEVGDNCYETGCCGHHVISGKKKIEILLHPLKHTITVFFFVFIVTFGLGLTVYLIGDENLSQFFRSGSVFQPAIVALVGLIPNCAASVIITQTFLSGSIGFGSAIAGLSTGGGLGILVLIREDKNVKDVLRVLISLYIIGTFFGTLIQLIKF